MSSSTMTGAPALPQGAVLAGQPEQPVAPAAAPSSAAAGSPTDVIVNEYVCKPEYATGPVNDNNPAVPAGSVSAEAQAPRATDFTAGAAAAASGNGRPAEGAAAGTPPASNIGIAPATNAGDTVSSISDASVPAAPAAVAGGPSADTAAIAGPIPTVMLILDWTALPEQIWQETRRSAAAAGEGASASARPSISAGVEGADQNSNEAAGEAAVAAATTQSPESAGAQQNQSQNLPGDECVPVLKIAAVSYDINTSQASDEVSYCVRCEEVRQFVSEEVIQNLLGMSKIVYQVHQGNLDTILPALLDKVKNYSEVIPVVWDAHVFDTQLRPHVVKALETIGSAAIAQVYHRFLAMGELLKSIGTLRSVPPTAVAAADMLHVPLSDRSDRHAMVALLKHAAAQQPNGLQTIRQLIPQHIVALHGGVATPTANGYGATVAGAATAGSSSAQSFPSITSPPRTDVASVMGGEQQTLTQAPQRMPIQPQVQERFFLKLRGLPWEAGTADVAQFLAPVLGNQVSQTNLDFIQILPGHQFFSYGTQGRCSGEAFVEVPNADLRDRCLKELHGSLIGRRWIEIFRATLTEWNNVMQAAGQRHEFPSEMGGVVRLRGLPWGSTEYDILRFFADGGFSVDVSSIFLPAARGSRSSGEAWVDFGNGAVAEEARKTLHRKCMGSRYIEIFPSNPRELAMVQRASAYGPLPPMPRGGRSSWLAYAGLAGADPTGAMMSGYDEMPYSRMDAMGMGGMGSPGGFPRHRDRFHAESLASPVLRLRGLPYGSNENHIVQFFTGFQMNTVLPATVPVDGRPSGEAYVEFSSPEEAMRAYQMRNGARMEHRYIELFPASKQEMDWAAAGIDSREIRLRLSKQPPPPSIINGGSSFTPPPVHRAAVGGGGDYRSPVSLHGNHSYYRDGGSPPLATAQMNSMLQNMMGGGSHPAALAAAAAAAAAATSWQAAAGNGGGGPTVGSVGAMTSPAVLSAMAASAPGAPLGPGSASLSTGYSPVPTSGGTVTSGLAGATSPQGPWVAATTTAGGGQPAGRGGGMTPRPGLGYFDGKTQQQQFRFGPRGIMAGYCAAPSASTVDSRMNDLAPPGAMSGAAAATTTTAGGRRYWG